MRKRPLKVECLESKRMLTAVSFSEPQVISDASPRSIVSGDINSDGQLDVLAVYSDSVVWHQNLNNLDGDIAFAANPLFENYEAHSAALADLDGDSDLDVLIAGGPGEPTFPENSWDIVWYENLDGNGTFSEEPILIGSSGWFWLGVLETADIDGDDDLDVLLGTGGGLGGGALSWFENDGGGEFVAEHPILGGESIAHVELHDMDADGDQDLAVLFGTDFNWMLFAWYENAGDNENFEQREIHQEFSFPQGGLLMDVDADGDLEPVYGVGGLDNESIGWNENLDGSGSFGEQEVLWDASGEEGFVSFSVLNADDFDEDGDTDVLFRVKNDLRLLINEGDGTFAEETIGKATGNTAAVVDINGDSRPDIVTTAKEGLVWLENEGVDPSEIVGDLNGDGEVTFPDFLILSANFGSEDATAEEGDLNGDGRVSFEDFLLFSANFGTAEA